MLMLNNLGFLTTSGFITTRVSDNSGFLSEGFLTIRVSDFTNGFSGIPLLLMLMVNNFIYQGRFRLLTKSRVIQPILIYLDIKNIIAFDTQYFDIVI